MDTAAAIPEPEAAPPPLYDSAIDSRKARRGEVVNGYVVYTRRGKRTVRSENEEAGGNAAVKAEEGGGSGEAVLNDLVCGRLKRHRRSTFKKAEAEAEVEAEAAAAAADGGDGGGVIAKREMELKVSTVKELFDTGLLDGVPVVYVGCKKDSTSGLRGVIIHGGILCSCCLCNGRRVIPPSQFEIHACNTYKRASQYICFENGKSLLELLGVCRAAPAHALEVTIQNFVGSPHEEKYFTCRSCRGCFPSSTVKRVGPICHSCVESRKSEDNSIHAVGKRVRSPRPMLFSSPSCSSELCISSRTKRNWKKRTKSSELSVKLKIAPGTLNPEILPPQNKSEWRIAKKYQRMHKLIFEENGLPDGAEVAYYARGQKFLEGIKRHSGILCHCCNTEVSPSQFEVHAGWASRQKPYTYIYTSDGVSLQDLATLLSKDRKYNAKYHDDACNVCWDDGNLMHGDGGPRAFQKAGRSERVVPVDQISKRCIRIVKSIDSEIGGCALCRGSDFSRSGFGPRTIIICDQCEKEYHVGCLRDHKIAYLKELPEGNWLCCNDCTRIHSLLENLLIRVAERLPESLLDVIKKKQEERCLEPLREIDVRWRLLNGRVASPETKPLLLEAVSMFHECFDPIVDPATGRDLIPAMVNGRNLRTQDFGGMYCALLMVNSSVASAAMLRIFGGDIAELPLIATRNKNRGKGYFQTLFSCIERLLSFLSVKNLVLPAAEEAESIWIHKFGFSKMEPDQLTNYRKNYCQMMAFKGTVMLHKTVPQCRVTNTQS
ncbi:increased DNA methylation 1-like isoform X2 [Lotus japonicus]|uniref:increased DNA methylation 1-like isoform X2 n=1 Tax=Lotus japonicus TaxID=34305 RepID=UPI00258E5008|nr:increased DNA methylation 1-like isoform X2 [Lotus japonicus]